ncbi:MAG: hypothetical protein R2941_05885 [Desulfobacterales bacterium]
MRVYIGFDDTDVINSDRGTGKLARWFESLLPEECRLWGVVRQQLLVHPDIPFTSHNSAACVIVDTQNGDGLRELIDRAARHVENHALEGSDPGLCVAGEGHPGLSELMEFGLSCTRSVRTQKDAIRASSGAHLSAHGGTDDGIIGAAAAVGLTASGWSGRFIEFGMLRNFPSEISVADLHARNIRVVSLDRDASIPSPQDRVLTKNWVRPRLFGARPVLMVNPCGPGLWENISEKRKKIQHSLPVPA